MGCLKASRSESGNRKARPSIYAVVGRGEAARANPKAADELVVVFLDSMEAEGFIPHQIFNCDETTLLENNAK